MTDIAVEDRKQSVGKPVRYGFHGRLKAEFPSQVIVDITEVCNLACIHCPHPEFKKSAHYAARYLEPELNVKLVDEVRGHGRGHTQYIRYTSEGEPLIHPKGYDMLQYAVDHSDVFVTLTTNGTIMNKKRTRRLLDSGIHMIDISIDAYSPEVYAQVRVGGDLDVTRAHVLNLIKWVRSSDARTKVVVSYIEQPKNVHETQAFERYWKEAGADYVVIRRLHSAAGAVKDVAKELWAEAGNQKRRPCVYPWERIVLNPRGYLAFCPADWTHGSTVVDYRSTTVRETWRGEFYEALRQAHLSNTFCNHGFCGQCPDWLQMRWPDEGRSYADMVEEFLRDGNPSLS